MSSGIMPGEVISGKVAPAGINRQLRAAAVGLPEKCTPPPGTFLKTREKVWCRKYQLAPDFIAFQGHFNGHPVLPALAQVLMAKDSVSAVLAQDVTIEAVEQGKFMSLVVPGNTVMVYARPPQGGGIGEWRFHLTATSQVGGADFLVADVSYLAIKIGDGFSIDGSLLALEGN